ncbi:MAG TPA: GNAT family protein [Actinomycetota bacterium]
MGEREGRGPSRPALEGELTRLRAVEPTDASILNPLFVDPDVLSGLQVAMPQSLQGFRDYVEWVRTKTDTAFFIIERLEDRAPTGGCSLEQIESRARTAVLGIWIGKPFWDRGYGTDAVRTICRFGFRHLNLQRIELNVFATNPRGRRAYEKVGFKLEGTRRRAAFVGGRHVDSHLMGLLAEELVE